MWTWNIQERDWELGHSQTKTRVIFRSCSETETRCIPIWTSNGRQEREAVNSQGKPKRVIFIFIWRGCVRWKLGWERRKPWPPELLLATLIKGLWGALRTGIVFHSSFETCFMDNNMFVPKQHYFIFTFWFFFTPHHSTYAFASNYWKRCLCFGFHVFLFIMLMLVIGQCQKITFRKMISSMIFNEIADVLIVVRQGYCQYWGLVFKPCILHPTLCFPVPTNKDNYQPLLHLNYEEFANEMPICLLKEVRTSTPIHTRTRSDISKSATLSSEL